MNRLTSLVRRYPIPSIAVLVAVAGGGFLLLSGGPQPPTGGAVVTPAPVASPVTPAPAPTGAAPPAPVPTPVPPPPPAQAAGRADPFAPLVRAQAGGGPPAPPVSLPPPPPLPPPLFPGPGASPGAPGAAPPAVVRLSAGAQLVGVLGDTGKVAIIKIGNEVFIVAQGEMIQNRIRVEVVDANAGLVVLIEDGERVELRFG